MISLIGGSIVLGCGQGLSRPIARLLVFLGSTRISESAATGVPLLLGSPLLVSLYQDMQKAELHRERRYAEWTWRSGVV